MPGRFSGVVRDSKTGEPIRGISVVFFNTTLEEMMQEHNIKMKLKPETSDTDSVGKFRSPRLLPGIYKIYFASPRYEPKEVFETLRPGSSYTLQNPVSLDPIAGLAGYSGRVFDRSTEQPIVGALIQLAIEGSSILYRVFTDTKGGFSVEDLRPGIYSVSFSAPGYRGRRLEQVISPDIVNPIKSPLGAVLLTPDDATMLGQSPMAVRSKIPFGDYHALIIGNDNYQGSIKKLKNAVNDAVAVEAILRESYGFQTKLLKDAAGHEIVGAINWYKKNLTENDNLLIYYSGHGIKDAGEAYWIPVNATDAEDNTPWVSSTIHIIKNLKNTKAKQVLVISDSCFAGAIDLRQLTQNEAKATTERERYLKSQIEGRSRTLLGSGGDEPVMDGGGGKHSIFTKALLTGLEKMENPIFTASELFRTYIEQQVSGNARQSPELKTLRDSGHEKGTFVFVRNR